MDAGQLLARARADSTVQDLDRYTQEAQDRGVFGSPFYLFGDEIYWGQDRLQFLEEALARATPRGCVYRKVMQSTEEGT
jgi:2-hydroxychromene-2-carboxylate isomerase